MNILFIGHEDYINGASKSLLNIIDALISDNNIHVLTSYSKGEFFDELQKRKVTVIIRPFYRWCVLKNGLINWIICLLKWKLKHVWINHKTAMEMVSYIIENKIDIIHSNTSVINIGALISNKCNVKHVWHIREFADIDFDMYPLIKKQNYYNYMNRNADKFICVSNAIKAHYSFLEENKKVVIYNGIDSKYCINRAKNIESNIIKFLIAGRISIAKGQQEAIKACELLSDRGITNFELYIAGTGTYSNDFSEKIKDKVHFLGTIKDMTNLRKNMHIELVCSRAEAFGRVTAEAMMGGVPVIGSNTGGTLELIQPGITGYLYEYGNVKDLADKMSHLISNPELRLKMGYNAQIYAKKNFTIDKCITEIKTLYMSLI